VDFTKKIAKQKFAGAQVLAKYSLFNFQICVLFAKSVCCLPLAVYQKKASHLVPAKKLGANIGEIGPINAK